MKRVLSFFVAVLLIILSSDLKAEPESKDAANLTGIKQIAPYFQIFPENKMGNVVYKENKKLFSAKNLILKDIIRAPGGYVFHAANNLGKSLLGFINEDGPGTIFKALKGGFYLFRTEKSQRKLYRLNHKKEIQDLLPKSNTASGLIYNNHDKAAFFHVAKGEPTQVGGEEKYKYWFVLHVVWDNKVEVAHLPELIGDFYINLRLEWANKDTLKYILSNGYSKNIRVE